MLGRANYNKISKDKNGTLKGNKWGHLHNEKRNACLIQRMRWVNSLTWFF